MKLVDFLKLFYTEDEYIVLINYNDDNDTVIKGFWLSDWRNANVHFDNYTVLGFCPCYNKTEVFVE